VVEHRCCDHDTLGSTTPATGEGRSARIRPWDFMRRSFMARHLSIGLAVLSLLLLGSVATAQDEETFVPIAFASGGGSNSLRHLDTASDSNFKLGYNVGGGFGLEINRWVAIRAAYTYSRAETEGSAFSPVFAANFNRHYYGADVQLRADLDSGLSPYAFAGGGAVTVKPEKGAVFMSPTGVRFANETFTKPAGRFGVGFQYQVPDSSLSLYAEASGWAYQWDRYGFDRTQVDTTWGAGISYRFGD
jgi:opacity protein-like surface antigen